MSEEKNELKRGLSNRHIQLIALGGAIGTGLFLGTASTIKTAGPAVLVSYAIGGTIAFFIMRQLGEMITQEPIAGSFSNLAHKYWGDYPGWLSGWNYWMHYVLASMAELTAVSVYVQYWFPDVANWQSIAFFFILINAINLTTVKVFGELEFWFASIKIAAIIGMIMFGGYLLMTAGEGSATSISNLWRLEGGFFPAGLSGVVLALAAVMFSFGGLELVGITAAETDNPRKTIPAAINQIIYRILIFYIGAIVVLLALYPWNKLNLAAGDKWSEAMAGSPFVMIFANIGIPSAAHILNFVVLTAALSVYNSCVYCNSRMLYGLAQQGNAPKVFGRTNKRGIPVAALLLSSGTTLLCIVLNYLLPSEALGILFALVISCLVINWGVISFTHIKFRQAKIASGEKIYFKAFWFPFANYVCIAFMVLIMGILWYVGQHVAVMIMPFWIGFISLGYLLKKAALKRSGQAVEQKSGDSTV